LPELNDLKIDIAEDLFTLITQDRIEQPPGFAFISYEIAAISKKDWRFSREKVLVIALSSGKLS
jgi:hypothetical protein